jgi:hypothetical protein
MKHQLMHPAYADLVRQWIDEDCANDNHCPGEANDREFAEYADELGDPFFHIIGAIHIAATRLW